MEQQISSRNMTENRFSAFHFGENYENLITTIQFSLVPKLVFLSWLKKASWTLFQN